MKVFGELAVEKEKGTRATGLASHGITFPDFLTGSILPYFSSLFN